MIAETPPELAWLGALRCPQAALDWSLGEWERVIRLARRARLLARLGASIDAAGLLASVPAPARRHLVAEWRQSRARTTAVRWAVERIGDALSGADYPRLLLKGAAYMAQSLPIAPGRMPSDLDILVPRGHLDDAQRRLVAAGWQEAELDAHDRRYYVEFSHELPPMRHPMFEVELDVHHNIVPPTPRLRLDADVLLADIRPSGWPGWSVLQPVDQVLHSAAHLFFDSEFRDRIRDLVDLDMMLRHFGADPAFWPRLVARAQALRLIEPLGLAFHFTTTWLGTPVPDTARQAVPQPGPALRHLLAWVLWPVDPDRTTSRRARLAATALLVRYQWRRLPLRQLIPHAWHKWRKGDGLAPEVAKPEA